MKGNQVKCWFFNGEKRETGNDIDAITSCFRSVFHKLCRKSKFDPLTYSRVYFSVGCGTAFDFHKTMDYMFLVGK